MEKKDIYDDVIEFNDKVIGLEVPDKLSPLKVERLSWFLKAATEELSELVSARRNEDLYGEVDAIIDLLYFSLGRLYEMGVSKELFHKYWSSVHQANMLKKKGNKGRGSDIDAIKPEGWKGPVFNDK